MLPESHRGGLDGEGRDCEGACMSLGVAFAHCPRSHLVDARLRNATGGSMGPMNGIIERCSLQNGESYARRFKAPVSLLVVLQENRSHHRTHAAP